MDFIFLVKIDINVILFGFPVPDISIIVILNTVPTIEHRIFY